MKNTLSKILAIGIAFALAFTFSCSSGSSGGGGTETVTYSGTTSTGDIFSLQIADNTKVGDSFEFTWTSDNGTKTSSGTVKEVNGNEFTMLPSNAATPNATFTVTVSDDGLTAMSGEFTWTDGTTSKGSGTLTPSGGPCSTCQTSSGGLTFSDGLPSGQFSVAVVPNSTDTDLITLMGVMASPTAYGGYTVVSGNTVPLFTPANVAWTGSGTYMVVLALYTGSMPDFKYKKDVSFSGGNATIRKSDFISSDGISIGGVSSSRGGSGSSSSGGELDAGASNAGTKLKASISWNSYNITPAGTDDFGFSALPGGHSGSSGSFYSVGTDGYWWSASQNGTDYAFISMMSHTSENVRHTSSVKNDLLSVRCLKD